MLAQRRHAVGMCNPKLDALFASRRLDPRTIIRLSDLASARGDAEVVDMAEDALGGDEDALDRCVAHLNAH